MDKCEMLVRVSSAAIQGITSTNCSDGPEEIADFAMVIALHVVGQIESELEKDES